MATDTFKVTLPAQPDTATILNGKPVRILPVGKIYRQSFAGEAREINITPDDLKAMVKNHAAGLPRYRLAINKDHSHSGGKVGTVNRIEFLPNAEQGAGLYAVDYELLPAGKRAVLEEGYDATSAEVAWEKSGYDFRYLDPHTGKKHDNVLVGLALTPYPAAGHQPPTGTALFSVHAEQEASTEVPPEQWASLVARVEGLTEAINKRTQPAARPAKSPTTPKQKEQPIMTTSTTGVHPRHAALVPTITDGGTLMTRYALAIDAECERLADMRGGDPKSFYLEAMSTVRRQSPALIGEHDTWMRAYTQPKHAEKIITDKAGRELFNAVRGEYGERQRAETLNANEDNTSPFEDTLRYFVDKAFDGDWTHATEAFTMAQKVDPQGADEYLTGNYSGVGYNARRK